MGVLGLWKLLDATGKPVPLETLEGKVLAIDISIWIHQVIQGYQDRRGNAIPNAHLIGLFNRICKLMYFKIKPVFVFDGGVPLLKKNTIATRRKLKSIAASKAQKLKNDLINNLIKHTAVKGVLDKGNDEGESSTTQQSADLTVVTGSSKIQDIYKLPDLPIFNKFDNSEDYVSSDDECQMELSPRKQSKWMGNIHSVDVNNEEFKNLPADVRYDILTDLKETRKQNSWGRVHELPKGSNNYSGFQVNRLLKRRYVQESLEIAEKEMGGKTLTLEELDKLLTDQGINTTQQQDIAYRIASDSKTRVIYVKDKADVKNKIDDSSQISNAEDSNVNKLNVNKESDSNSNDAFMDSTSINSDSSVAVIDNIKAYDLDDEWTSDGEFTENTLNDSQLLPKSNIPKSVMNPALAYMLEHSGLTRDQILKLVEQNKKNKLKSDGNSSHGSSKKSKRIPKRLSLDNKNKKKKLFNKTITDSPKIKKETLDEVENSNASDIVSTIESGSESDDFIEVSEKINNPREKIKSNDPDKTITKESSESESDDFVEIADVPIPELLKIENLRSDSLQITIKADQGLQDDIFADIFTNLDSVEKISTNTENKPTLHKIEKEISLKSQFSIMLEKEKESVEIKEKKNDSFKSEDGNKNNSLTHSFNNSQPELKNIILPTTSHKVISNNVNNIFKDSENCTETVNAKEVVEKKSKQNVPTSKNEVCENIDSTLNHISINSGNPPTAINIEESEKEVTVKEPPLVLPVDEKELASMKEQLEIEQQQIAGNLGKLERQAIDITDQMRLEAQELLRLFGIPYLVAPMEAEAQCAYLEQIKLTDGTITDDSDIWLFGGHCVYKNFFDNNKKVLQFLSNDIEHHFKLSRKELIQLALLVGSDYTNGLAGVGPVTALEILASFPSDGEDILRGLRAFCSWFRAGKLAAPGKISLRNKLKNIHIEKGFPSQAVVQAYICPTIDESKEIFTWSKPNLVLLADYAKKKFGWTKLKFDEIINPVMKRLSESKSQKGIESYFKVHTVPKSIEAALSKRVQTALQKLGDKGQDREILDNEESSTNDAEKSKKPKKATGRKTKKWKDESSELPSIKEINEDDTKAQEITKIKEQINTSIKISPQKSIIESQEIIPQREKDKANALKTKLKAIEIFRKSKKGLGHVSKRKKVVKKIKEEAELSESSDSS